MIEYDNIEKDQSVIDILRYLEDNLDLRQVVVSDYWEMDLCAIGLKKEDKLVYLAVDDIHKGVATRYDYDFEILNEEDETDINVVKKARSADRITLLQDLKTFWEL